MPKQRIVATSSTKEAAFRSNFVILKSTDWASDVKEDKLQRPQSWKALCGGVLCRSHAKKTRSFHPPFLERWDVRVGAQFGKNLLQGVGRFAVTTHRRVNS